MFSGYRYGNTLVPMSQDDKDNMKYKAEKCLKVLGFTKIEHVSTGQILNMLSAGQILNILSAGQILNMLSAGLNTLQKELTLRDVQTMSVGQKDT